MTDRISWRHEVGLCPNSQSERLHGLPNGTPERNSSAPAAGLLQPRTWGHDTPRNALPLERPQPRKFEDRTPRATLAAASLSREEFKAVVGRAVAAIRAGRVEKLVIARDASASIPADSDRRALLHELADRYPDCVTFAVDGLIGASPETLVSVHGGEASARSRRQSGARGEHRRRLRGLRSVGDEWQRPRRARLRRAERARRPAAASARCLSERAAVHPQAAEPVASRHRRRDATGSVVERARQRGGAAPHRGRHAGPVGWIDQDGDGEWVIALRCARIDDDGLLTAYAGAGIVADSDPDFELAETRMKFRPVADSLR